MQCGSSAATIRTISEGALSRPPHLALIERKEGVRRRGGRRKDSDMRVVIADDHTFYREGLARLLRKFGVDVVGEAPDGETAVRLVEETSPDVVLLDLRMPGVSGLEAVRMLTDDAAATRVLVLSVSAEES